jgi:acetyltransferase-like isoleucine patch superfamily enzyme
LHSLLRNALVAVAVLLTAPFWLLVRLEAALTGGESFFTGCSELFSLIPGRVGIFLRRGLYFMTLDAFAVDCHIGFGATLAHRKVRIGRGVIISSRCTVGQVVIEDHVAIGSHVNLLSGRRQHNTGDLSTPILKQGGQFQTVRIGRNSWIGNSAVIMADVGADCVIGAGSVVVHPIPARSVAVGNPATVKKQRGPFAATASVPEAPHPQPRVPAGRGEKSGPHPEPLSPAGRGELRQPALTAGDACCGS